MTRIVLMLAAGALLAGCATEPKITKETMTLAEANIEGLECRIDNPMGSNMPRTICASPAAWAKYDRNQEFNTDKMLENGRSSPNNAFDRRRMGN
jgi:hypothetical protein